MFNGIGTELEANRNMTIGQFDHELVEVSVTHHDDASTATIKVAALAHEREECRIDKQLLLAVGFGGRGSRQVLALAGG